MYQPNYDNSINMKKVFNVCHIMESFSFTMNIYGRQPYLLDSSVLSKKSPSL